MAISIWGFSSAFAVYEPAPGYPPELLDTNQPKPPPALWLVPKLVETFEVRGKPAYPGDFPGTTGFMHLLSPRAVDAVGEVFGDYGHLYPVQIDGMGDGWRLFQPLTVADCLDIDRSKVSRNVSRPDEINSILNPVFVEGRTPKRGLFRVPQCLHGDIYVCDDIKDLVKKHRLKGFVLSPDFFGKPWIS